MELVNLTELGAQLLTVSALSKVGVDLLKLKLKKKLKPEVKYVVAMLLSIAITLCADISLFEDVDGRLQYVGVVLAGFIAGLGSNFIHEILKALQTFKGLNK